MNVGVLPMTRTPEEELLWAIFGEAPIDPEPYITVYAGTGAPLFSRHAVGGNGTANMPRHGYADHDCDQWSRYAMPCDAERTRESKDTDG
jgi:hypothetical protein